MGRAGLQESKVEGVNDDAFLNVEERDAPHHYCRKGPARGPQIVGSTLESIDGEQKLFIAEVPVLPCCARAKVIHE